MLDTVTAENAHIMAEQWKVWCDSKKFFVKSPSKNLLARMMPAPPERDVDGELSAELAYFNMAIHSLVDMGDTDANPFLYYYWRRARNIKAVAHKLGIGRRTFYKARDRFAMKALRLARNFRSMSESVARQGDLEILEID
jgi:hypothetical protein